MKKFILLPFVFFAAIGLLLTAGIHISAVLKLPFEHYGKVLCLAVGVFVVWLPTVLVSFYLSKDFKQKDFWKAAMRGCPNWLKKTVTIIIVYSFINFIYMMISGSPDEDSLSTARFISGHLLIFYSVALAVLYSAINIGPENSFRRCPNGHTASISAKFCEECGLPINS